MRLCDSTKAWYSTGTTGGQVVQLFNWRNIAITLIIWGGSVQNRRRLAVAFAVFGLLANAALAIYFEVPHFQPWMDPWIALIPFACPANYLLGSLLYDTDARLLIWVLQTILNAAIYFGLGTLLGRLFWR